MTPELLYALAAASEHERILLAPNNFPSSEFSMLHLSPFKKKTSRPRYFEPTVIRAGGLHIGTLLREIMKLIKVANIKEFLYDILT